MERQLDSNDILCKFSFEKSNTTANGSIRARVLSPREGELLSMFEMTNEKHEYVCQHGHDYADNSAKNSVHIGYCSYLAEIFMDLELGLIYDNDPPRHVSVSFPDDLAERKLKGKLLQNKCLVVGQKNAEEYYFNPCE